MIVNFESELAKRKNICHDKKSLTSTGNKRDSRTRLSVNEAHVARSPKIEFRGLSGIDAAGGCDVCGRDYLGAPMLHGHEWLRLARMKEYLCAYCLHERAASRNIKLTLASLKPVAFNLILPYPKKSWFSIYASFESDPPSNIGEWRKVAASNFVKAYQVQLHPWFEVT